MENSLNLVLDIIFQEDKHIIWNKKVAQNEALIRQIGLNLVKCYQSVHPLNKRTEKVALKTLRKSLVGDDFGMLFLMRGVK